MDIGISTACLHSRCETEDAITKLNQLGVKVCEVFLQTYYEYRPEFAKKFAPRAEGMTVNSVHAMTNFEPQLFYDTRRARGDGFYWLDQVMRSAQLFKAGKYTFHGRSRKIGDGGDDFSVIAERLNEVIKFCSGYGVKLCLENVRWSLYNRPGVFKELKNRCPELCGVFDIKQARLSGYPYPMYINEMSGSISHIHISDVDEKGGTCLPGKGLYDFEEVFKRLKDAGFDGCALIEVYSGNYGEECELRQSLEFLNEIIYKLN